MRTACEALRRGALDTSRIDHAAASNRDAKYLARQRVVSTPRSYLPLLEMPRIGLDYVDQIGCAPASPSLAIILSKSVHY